MRIGHLLLPTFLEEGILESGTLWFSFLPLPFSLAFPPPLVSLIPGFVFLFLFPPGQPNHHPTHFPSSFPSLSFPFFSVLKIVSDAALRGIGPGLAGPAFQRPIGWRRRWKEYYANPERERVPPLFPALLGTRAAWRKVNGKERYKRALNWNQQLKRQRRARFLPFPGQRSPRPGLFRQRIPHPSYFVKGFEKSKSQPTFSPERLSSLPDWKAETQLA